MKAFWKLIARVHAKLLWSAYDAQWRSRFARVGDNFVFDPVTSRFVTPELFRAGNDCFINADAHVSGDVTLGDRVMIGPSVKLLSGNHLFGIEGYYARFLRAGIGNPERVEPQSIEDDCWLAANVVVLGGVNVGKGSVVAAGSVVTTDIPPFTVAAGVPARAIRRIFDDETLKRHLVALGQGSEADSLIARRRLLQAQDLPVWSGPRQDFVHYQGERIELRER